MRVINCGVLRLEFLTWRVCGSNCVLCWYKTLKVSQWAYFFANQLISGPGSYRDRSSASLHLPARSALLALPAQALKEIHPLMKSTLWMYYQVLISYHNVDNQLKAVTFVLSLNDQVMLFSFFTCSSSSRWRVVWFSYPVRLLLYWPISYSPLWPKL